MNEDERRKINQNTYFPSQKSTFFTFIVILHLSIYIYFIVSSIFNTVTIKATLQSRHVVTCSIYKLWYHWMNVYLSLDNGTKAYTLVNVSNNGVVSVSDQRLNATLQKGAGTDEPDNVSFVFEFPEEACDLEGSYTCQFKMVENLNTKFAGLSVFAEGIYQTLF